MGDSQASTRGRGPRPAGPAGPAGAGGRGREYAVLGAGLTAAAALVWAALTVHAGLRTAGEVAVARLSGTVEATVVAEWEGMLRAGEPPVPFAPDAAFRLADEPALAPRELVEPASGGLSVFATLLAEAERLELVEDDPAGALELVREAQAKEPAAPLALEGELRALQLGLRLQRADVVEASWEGLRTADINATRRGIPYRLLAALALPSERRAALAPESIVTTAELESLFLEQDRLRFTDDGGAVFEPAPLLVVLCERLGRDLPPLERRRARALAALGPLPDVADDGRWHLVELAGHTFVARRAGAEVRGAFTGPEALAHALAARASLPEGFALDFAGTQESLGVALRPRAALPGSALAFTLRHADPAALGRAETEHGKLLRGALLALALGCAGGGWLVARVLARERKLAALKSAFVAGVSHDLRTPLASILLLTENLESGAGERERTLRALRKEAARLRRRVDDVLDFSRLERGQGTRIEREELALAPFVDELAAELGARVERAGRAFACERGALPPAATLDAQAVRRALENLVQNALEHGRGAVTLACAAEGAALCFTVADQGAGVPAAERERVFEPFLRLNGAAHAGGTGLGLAIVRAIARGHGGEARVRPAPGGGACFELELPLDGGGEGGP